ncbi:hypothetical protein BD410DRAFT_792449 [Rickenella mellea]|uniref:Uncharacterized protein n=1 Tax=Rickenella mellea TaxID=50990 RepID=A0A4Y7PVY8_9AGAM|nr:hypothetical protein BD410DRAFT_792449 [Rickenella mellea]
MKFFILIMLVAVIPAALAQRGESILRVGDFKLDKLNRRACVPSKCDCTGFAPGLFCGDGFLGCKKGVVYQCDKDGHTSCDLGLEGSCSPPHAP